MLFYYPLEQFENIFLFRFLNYYFLNNILFNIYIIINLMLLGYIFVHIAATEYLISNKMAQIKELFISFINYLLLNNSSFKIKFQFYFLLFLLIFIFLNLSNILGLVPYSYCITSQIIITFMIACFSFLSFNIICIINQKKKFLTLFFPSNVPLWILPFLIIIEFFSYCGRIFSLAIRLFANMVSGHALLNILITFIWIILLSCNFWVYFTSLGLSIIYLIFTLEFAVSILQAYVFTVLNILYFDNLNNIA